MGGRDEDQDWYKKWLADERQLQRDPREVLGWGGGGSSRSRASLQIPFWFFGAAFGVAQVIDRVFT